MKETPLKIELLSGTTPGIGEGTAGEVDMEVEHDQNGLPFVRGKTIHGLLLNSWTQMVHAFPELHNAGLRVFGKPGLIKVGDAAILRVGDAVLPKGVRSAVDYAVNRSNQPISPNQILRSLTFIRRQTAQSRETGAAEDTTLRSTRVVIPGLEFTAPLTWLCTPTPEDEKCLALAVLATRQIGTNCHRGYGYVKMSIDTWENTRALAGLEGHSG